jgi:hypothetical protein
MSRRYGLRPLVAAVLASGLVLVHPAFRAPVGTWRTPGSQTGGSPAAGILTREARWNRTTDLSIMRENGRPTDAEPR